MADTNRAPVLVAATVRDEYGHVARQRCHCGGTFLVHNEYIEQAAPDAGNRVHVLVARCLNSDCRHEASFRFQLTFELCAGGLGGAIVGTLNAADPARTFPCIGVAHQVAIGLVSTWAAARAAGIAPDLLRKLIADATRHTGVSAELAEEVAGHLAELGPRFDGIVAALARECAEGPTEVTPGAA